MKILVVPKLHEGARVEELQQHRIAEIQAVWDLYARGICREFYARADQPGAAVFMVESESVAAAREVLQALPLLRLHLLDLDLIPLAPFTHLQSLFQAAS
jgi:hypothetical protein